MKPIHIYILGRKESDIRSDRVERMKERENKRDNERKTGISFLLEIGLYKRRRPFIGFI